MATNYIDSPADLRNIGKAHASSSNWATGLDDDGNPTSAYDAWTMSDTYIQTADIDMSGVANFKPIGFMTTTGYVAFTGTYNGGGYTISNLTVSYSSDSYLGLFAYLNGTIQDVKIDSFTMTGYSFIGGIAGLVISGSITRCVIDGGTFTATLGSTSNNLGGIVGMTSTSATITACAVLNLTLAGGTGWSVGGISGNSANTATSSISYCYVNNLSTVCVYSTGGIIGGGYISITNCFVENSHMKSYSESASIFGWMSGSASILYCGGRNNLLEVTSTGHIGGICGRRSVNTGSIKNCFAERPKSVI